KKRRREWRILERHRRRSKERNASGENHSSGRLWRARQAPRFHSPFALRSPIRKRMNTARTSERRASLQARNLHRRIARRSVMDQKESERHQKAADEKNDPKHPPQQPQAPTREPLAPQDPDGDEDVEDDDRFQATDN